jgi:hypothetical protein
MGIKIKMQDTQLILQADFSLFNHCNWLRHYAASQKVKDSIPDVTGFF